VAEPVEDVAGEQQVEAVAGTAGGAEGEVDKVLGGQGLVLVE
jgi:hypothetical protein